MDFAAYVKYALYPEQTLQVTAFFFSIVCLFFSTTRPDWCNARSASRLSEKKAFRPFLRFGSPRQSILVYKRSKVFHPIHELPLIESKGVAGWSHCNSS